VLKQPEQLGKLPGATAMSKVIAPDTDRTMALTPPPTQRKRLAWCNGDSLRESWRGNDAGSKWPAKPGAPWDATHLKRAVLFPGRSSAGKRLTCEPRPSGHVNAGFLFRGPAVRCLSTNVSLYTEFGEERQGLLF